MNADAKAFFDAEDTFPLTPHWYYNANLRVPNPRLKPAIWGLKLPWPVRA